MLTKATYPALRDRILAYKAGPEARTPRSYPGYPRVALPAPRRRLFAALDLALARRRTPARLSEAMPSRRQLGQILGAAHGSTGPEHRGPSPSAGNLQAVEIYLATLSEGWLAPGVHHYDRRAHALARVAEPRPRAEWEKDAPSLALVPGGALFVVLAGDLARVEEKYGERAEAFLLLEAGHVMQSLALVATSLDLAVAPLGAFFERAIGRAMGLPGGDRVLYAAVLGEV